MKRFLLLAVAVLAFVGCNNVFEDEQASRLASSELPTLMAGFEEDTRTYVEQNTYLRWHADDRLTIFYGNTMNRQYRFNGKSGDNSGSFSHIPSGNIETGNSFDHIYAVYPYDATISLDDINKSMSLTLPAQQTYAEDSFGRGANTMVAVTENLEDTFLSFKNVGGYLKIRLYGEGTVKSIELRGNNGEKIAGNANITATYGGVPKIAMADDATESVMLDCGSGVMLSSDAESPTEFWFVVPPTEFSKGITISVTNTDGGVFEQTTTYAVAIERNIIQPMAAIEVEFEVYDPTKPAKNEIWYTSSDDEIVKPDTSPGFGVNILSNTYEDGRGVITFDGAVTTIGGSAFSNCDSLTSITIPNSVTTIGGYAFGDCDNLTSVTIGDSVTTIEYQAFFSCDSLTSVTIGDSVTTIGNSAFYDCDSLTSITIPDSVTTIGDMAFGYCDSLTSVTIGGSVTAIEDSAFKNCSSLTSVTIGDSVTTIGKWAFYYCDSLTSITIPDSVTTIGDYAFSHCKSLTSITIPDSVTWIGDYAFYYCESLTSVYCKATTPPSIGYYVFSGNANSRKIYVPTASVDAYKSADGWRDYASYIVGYDFEKGEVAPEGPRNNEIWYTSSDGNIVTPNTSNVFGATIVSNTYENGKGVITFDGAVTKIVYYAFSDCDGLTSVTIPDSVTTIGDSAFASCDSLTSVTIPDSVTTIEFQAFNSCKSLTSITIPDSVTTIGDYAFASCDSLTSVTIPDSVTKLGYGVFAGCSLIKEFKGKFAEDNGRCLIVDNTLIAYADKSGTEYTIPDSVTAIGECAFSDCDSLTSVTIPDSVTTIGNAAFGSCNSLTSVYCKATTPPIMGFDVFYDKANSRKIYVPINSVNAYKSADGWSYYADAITGFNF